MDIVKSVKGNETQGFRLIISLYNETEPSRVAELLYCLKINNNHELIEDIYIFYDTSKDDDKNIIYNEIIKNKNVKILKISGKPTFKQLFQYANDNLPDTKVIISNSDIYFDDSLHLLNCQIKKSEIIFLTRVELISGKAELLKLPNNLPNFLSADSWIFNSPFELDFYCDYELGTMFCDSFLANQLFNSSKKVSNLCLDIKSFHLHQSISTSQLFERDEMKEMKQEVYKKEYERNGKKNPVSGVIWCKLEEQKIRKNKQYRWTKTNIIIDVTGFEPSRIDEIIPDLTSLFYSMKKNIWLVDYADLKQLREVVHMADFPFINIINQYVISDKIIYYTDKLKLEEIVSMEQDLYITSNLLDDLIRTI